jgi:hypothetical protein
VAQTFSTVSDFFAPGGGDGRIFIKPSTVDLAFLQADNPHDAIEQFGALGLAPNKIALELRDLNGAVFDFGNERGESDGLWFGQVHNCWVLS